jgi:hypothetical protein
MPPGFLLARGPLKWFLRRHGFAAVTMPWRRVYMLPEWQDYEPVIQHERVHLEQIDREGPIRFTLLYLYWTLRYGYERNPFEVEAYTKAPV